MDIIGQKINQRYDILALLGEGGMSFVFKAYDNISGRQVALKFMKEKVTSIYLEDIIRFQREINIISKLDHPHIVKVYGAGEYEHRPFIVMEYLDGKTLAETLQEGTVFSEKDAAGIAGKLAEALQYVHSLGVTHRDLKPANIFLGKSAVKILDFGVSHIIEFKEVKEEAQITGTFGYMSPEATGILNRMVDERSDLYSLGIILYRLLTGQLPFNEKNLNRLLYQQAALILVPPQKINYAISKVLEEIVMKLLMKDPEERYQSASGLVYDLERFSRGEREFLVGEKDQKIKLTYQTKLVGREAELETIKGLYHKAQKGQGGICLVSGEAGVGKSRLIEEIRGYIYKHDGLFLKGRCLNHENKSPYQPFKDALDDFLAEWSRMAIDVREQRAVQLRNALGDLGGVIIGLNPRMSLLTGETRSLAPLEPERENQRFLMVLSDFIHGLPGEAQACVIYLDDLQWSDEDSLNLLAEILKKIHKSNLLILGAYRDNETGPGHGLTRLREIITAKDLPMAQIKLSAFDETGLNELLAGILGKIPGNIAGIAAYILKKSGGNPFFAINILREMVENKILAWQDFSWQMDWGNLDGISVSGSMVDIILHRIKSLNPVQIDLLCKAAVIGREFELELLYRLTELDRARVIGHIDEMIAMQLLETSREKGRLLFAHDRIRDAFIIKLEAAERKRIHGAIAGTLEELHKHDLESVLFELAHHYVESGNREKSLIFVLPAADKARDTYANAEAVKYYQIGIELLEMSGLKGKPTWLSANENLINVFLTMGRNEDVLSVSGMILPLFENPQEKARIYKKIGMAYFKKGEWENCEKNLIKALDFLGVNSPQDNVQLTIAILKELIVHFIHTLVSRPRGGKANNNEEKYREILWTFVTLNYLYVMTDLIKFVYHVLRMLNLSEKKLRKSKELGVSITAFATIHLDTPILFRRSLVYNRKALKIRTEIGDEWGIAQNHHHLGRTFSWLGDRRQCVEHFNLAIQKYKKVGDIWELGLTCQGLSTEYTYHADFQKAEKYGEQYLEISESIKDIFGVVSAYVVLSYIYIETGNFTKAGELLTKAIAVCEEKKIWYTHCCATIYYGYMELERGNYANAAEWLEKAKKLRESNHFLKEYTVIVYPLLADAYLKKYDNHCRNRNYSITKSDQKLLWTTCQTALKKTRFLHNHYGVSLRTFANYYALIKKSKKAQKYFLRSIAHLHQAERKFELAKTYYEYGIYLNTIHEHEAAKKYWQQAVDIFNEIETPLYVDKCAQMLGEKAYQGEPSSEPSTRLRLKTERRMETALMTSRYISSILDIHVLLGKIMDSAVELVGAERGLLMLYQENDHNVLELKLIRNVSNDEIQNANFKASQSIISRVQQEKKPIIIADASLDHTFRDQYSIILQKTKSVLCAPIVTKGEMLGIIYLDSSLLSGLFTEEDLEILTLIANQAGVSIENARLYKEIQESRDKLAKWNQILEQRMVERNEQLREKDIELNAMLEKLQIYSATVQELAVSKERNRFAIDMHDTLGNTLALLIKQLEYCRIICKKEPQEAEEKINEAISVALDGMKELKRSIFGLAPEKLEANNLLKGLVELFADFESSGIHVEFSAEGIYDYRNPAYTFVLYKISQEALTNALRHGKAKNATVILKFMEDKIQLIIIDDGRGCKNIVKGFGLSGMEQRIAELNGNISFISDGENGFTVRLELPLKGEQ